MAIDPQIEAMLAAAPPWPGVRNMPLDVLRKAVHDSSVMLPPAGDAMVGRSEDRTIAGPAGALPLRLYWPQGEGPHPVTLYMHGGGFVVGDLDTQDMIARALCAWGETLVVSVDYRLAPEHRFPAGIEDCWAALAWVAGNAAALGGDPAHIAVAGDSAGGNLAAALALMARDAGGPPLSAQIIIYGSCTYPDADTASSREFADGPLLSADDIGWFWEQYLADPEREQGDFRASPAKAGRHDGLPPAFIATAECDPSRDDAEIYGRILKAAGVTVTTTRYPGMVHGFASWVGILPGARQALEDAAAFLKQSFAGAATNE